MISMEMKKRSEWISQLDELLSQRYPSSDIGGRKFFHNPGGGVFCLSPFPGELAAVLEYGENQRAAELNCLEDGDRFYMDEGDVAQVFSNMIAEIEQ